MTTYYSETNLIELIRQNNREGFNYLYENYAPALYVVINKIIDNKLNCEDVLQETFVSIYKNIDQYNTDKGRFYTWMRSIARNKAIDFIRCSINIMNSKIDKDEYGAHEELFSFEPKTDYIGLASKVIALAPAYQKVIYLGYYKGHTFEEIADSLSMPLGTVKTRMRKALQLLREDFAYAM